MNNLSILNCAQGTDEWNAARCGIPTASQFDRIVTAGGKASEQATDYLAELLAEHVSGQKKSLPATADMQRGVELEPEARTEYMKETWHEVQEVGGIYLDDTRKILCSPDGIMPALNKGLEIKCPRMATHIKYLFDGGLPKKYALQVQGALWITGYETWDFVSYCPEFKAQPLFIHTAQRNETLIKALDKHVRAFSEKLEALKEKYYG